MKQGTLKVSVDYSSGYAQETEYRIYTFFNTGVVATMLYDTRSMNHATQVYYGVDGCANPEIVFGEGANITYTWVEPVVNVPGRVIGNGDDMNKLFEPGVYFRQAHEAQGVAILNAPPMMLTSTFALEVLPAGGDGQLVQRATRCNKVSQVVAQRMYYGGAWGEWETVSINGQRVLWEGGHYMTASQTAQLSDKVSNMEKGIVLVFSIYHNGKPADSCWNFESVPKKMVEMHPGLGVSVFLSNSDMAKIGHKYLYVHDDRIVGHASNSDSGTASGIQHANNYFVLRYVLGE